MSTFTVLIPRINKLHRTSPPGKHPQTGLKCGISPATVWDMPHFPSWADADGTLPHWTI